MEEKKTKSKGWIKNLLEKFPNYARINRERDGLVNDEIRNFGPSPIRGIMDGVKSIDVLEAAREQLYKNWMGSSSLRVDIANQKVTWEQNIHSQSAYMEELRKDMQLHIERNYNSVLYGEAYTYRGRDVNPENISIERREYPRITDIPDGAYSDAVDALRYMVHIHEGGRNAGKTGREFIRDAYMDWGWEGLAELPNMRMATGWQNHGGDFNIIVRSKEIWKEEHIIAGPAW
jgi:hypothetical protein